MNNRAIFGIILVLVGILVLVFPQILTVIVGLGCILVGLWIALQNAPSGGGGNI